MAEQLYKTVTIDIIAAAVRFPYYSEISLAMEHGMLSHFLIATSYRSVKRSLIALLSSCTWQPVT